MGEKVAGIKVQIKPDGAKSGLREIDNETKKVAGSMRASLSSALDAGMKGGSDAVKGLFSSVKGLVGTLGGIVGGLGIAELTRGALEAGQKYRDMGVGVRFAGGSLKDVIGIQKQLQQTALETAHDSTKLVDVFEAIRGETGSIDFATDSIEDVAEAARGAHKPLEQMGSIAGTLNEKFGVQAGDELQGALADVIGLANKGGISFEDMAAKLGLIGADAKGAGLQGREGLGIMLGMFNLADNSLGSMRKAIPAVSGLLEQLGTTAGKAKIGAALGVSQKDMGGNAQQQIEAIMKATGGKKEKLEKVFGGEQLKFMLDIGKTYGAALSATAGDVKTKQAAAAEALRESFEAASKSTVSWADVQKEAASEMQQAPQKIATAVERLKQAFQTEQMQAALGKLIDKLPALAELIAKIVGFALDNPVTAVGGAVAAIFAKGAIGGVIEGAFAKGGVTAAASIGQAMTSGGSPLISALGGFGPAVGIFAVAAAAFVAASLYQAKLDQEKRAAEAKDAQKMLKGGTRNDKGQLERGTWGRWQASGALEGAGGPETDPEADLSDGEISGMSANDTDRVALEKRRAAARAARTDLVAGNTLARKFGLDTPQQSGGWTPASFDQGAGATSGGAAGPSAPTGPYATSGPIDTSAIGIAAGNAVASKELRVRVTNAGDFGAFIAGGPTSTGPVKPGNWPR